MDPFIAEIVMFGANFNPRGWAFCNGQLLPIASNTALFSLVGTIYGGDGRTTFALPDLRGRAPIHAGHGPGLSNYQLGQKGGVERVTLLTSEIPAHNHTGTLMAGTGKGNSPVNNGYVADTNDFDATGGGGNVLGVQTNNTGGSQSHNNMQPSVSKLKFDLSLF